MIWMIFNNEFNEIIENDKDGEKTSSIKFMRNSEPDEDEDEEYEISGI